MSENFSIKCFLSVFTVSVQLEEGDWFIYIYTRFIYIREFNMYMYLCALRIKSKKQRNIHILWVTVPCPSYFLSSEGQLTRSRVCRFWNWSFNFHLISLWRHSVSKYIPISGFIYLICLCHTNMTAWQRYK